MCPRLQPGSSPVSGRPPRAPLPRSGALKIPSSSSGHTGRLPFLQLPDNPQASPQHSTHTNLTCFVRTHILPSYGLRLARASPALTCPLVTGHITLLGASLKPQGPGWTPKLTTAQHGPLPELQTQRWRQRLGNTCSQQAASTAGRQEAEETKAQVEA